MKSREGTWAIQKLVNQETGLDARLAREAAFLQLRMLAETIALGCVIAHEGLSELSAPKVQKVYQADKIANELERLHPRFYPSPITAKRQEGRHLSIEDSKLPHLEKADLLRLYARRGEVLHRGTPKSLVEGERIDQNLLEEVMGSTQLIVNLLWSHAMVMRGERRALFCNLNTNSSR